MARVGRLAGALVVETGGAYHLVGHLRQPCDFAAAGFARPDGLDERAPRGLALEVTGTPRLVAPWLVVDVEGEPLVRLLVDRLLVERTGLVSERLWRLIVHEATGDVIDARWLGAVPDHVWAVVRDAVLRCA
ncbi:MAG TPA: hypothetical protein VM734_12815 [Kofleriaceae bacterium]|jgi:hypothetical protein|nr:hypothetical protein [Kofleriaceae bacterium]